MRLLVPGLLHVLLLLGLRPLLAEAQDAGARAALPPGCRLLCHQGRCTSTCTVGVAHMDRTGPLDRTGPKTGTMDASRPEVREQRPPLAMIQQRDSFLRSSSPADQTPQQVRVQVQAQVLRGERIYTEHSGFKYCFREVKDGQCVSPLPGLRTQEMCCRGFGQAWGTSDCVLCPQAGGNSSCQSGFHMVNRTKCVDVNECLKPGLCENGVCVNTMGSYSCVCKPGFILDASHGLCISRSVISEEKSQCFRVLAPDRSCSLPILRNITRQICCCSRVGKAWGPDCQRCPYFGSEAFKQTCPAGPGYQYSASTLQFSQRSAPHIGSPLVPPGDHNSQASGFSKVSESSRVKPEGGSSPSLSPPDPSGAQSTALSPGSLPNRASLDTKPSRSSGQTSRLNQNVPQKPPDRRIQDPQHQSPKPDIGQTNLLSQRRPAPTPQRRPAPTLLPQKRPALTPQRRPAPTLLPQRRPAPTPQRRPAPTLLLQSRPAPLPQKIPAPTLVPQRRPATPPQRLPAPTLPAQRRLAPPPQRIPTPPSQRRPAPPPQRTPDPTPPSQRRPIPARRPTMPPRVPQVQSVCRTSPDVCGPGRCVEQPRGRHTCECHEGYEPNQLRTFCQDRDECLQNPCGAALCTNTPGSFRCVCIHGYRLSNGSCSDIDECQDPLRCPGQECLNSPGSYRCVSCQRGFHLLDRRCRDVDECEAAGSCPGQECVNTEGSYRCVECRRGYQAVRGQCRDIDECQQSDVCAPGGECVNAPSSYTCVCADGFTASADRSACLASPPPDSAPSHALASEPLPSPWPGELRECYYNLAERGTCNLLATNTSLQECCCTVGEGWGLGCQYQACPSRLSVHFQVLCPSGRGYVTGSSAAFSYTDVDECKLFHPEVCKNGVCANNIPGYSCYCPSGYVYDATLLECVDYDECEEESCVGGSCVNTVGSYYCSCPAPLVLDNTQRTCVNASHLSLDENVSLCWQHVTADLVCQSPLLGGQVSFSDCCCLYGAGWGMECALCPAPDSDEYGALCSSVLPPPLPDGVPDLTAPGPDVGAGAGRGARFRSRPVGTRWTDDTPADTPRAEFSPYPDEDFGPPVPRTPSFYRPQDPRAERPFGARPPPPPPPLITEDYGTPFYERRPGSRRRGYDRRYEASAGDDCGILFGCENGRCVRVAEGYTCDCYPGYQLDLTFMTCLDVNECEDMAAVDFPCVNARCVNTDGSFRCVCRRGYVMSHRPNHCVAA